MISADDDVDPAPSVAKLSPIVRSYRINLRRGLSRHVHRDRGNGATACGNRDCLRPLSLGHCIDSELRAMALVEDVGMELIKEGAVNAGGGWTGVSGEMQIRMHNELSEYLAHATRGSSSRVQLVSTAALLPFVRVDRARPERLSWIDRSRER